MCEKNASLTDKSVPKELRNILIVLSHHKISMKALALYKQKTRSKSMLKFDD